MRQLKCPNCQRRVYFENFACLGCGADIAFDPDAMEMRSLGNLVSSEGRSKPCNNRQNSICNWLTAGEAQLCVACGLNRTIPNLSFEGNVGRWRRIEQAKRRVVVDLLRLGLPIVSRIDNPERGLAFDFLSSEVSGAPTVTGHDNGLVTLDVAEADDSVREARRHAMREPYRTLVGHFRHEIAHYYWSLLVQGDSTQNAVRAVFGDEREDYGFALQRHHNEGPSFDWSVNYISAYASSHPWEDWAETFAHFIHIVATMDAALNYAMTEDAAIADPYREPDFDKIIESFTPLTEAVNEINRAMGMQDFYPFVLSQSVIGKLHLVHMIVRKAALTAAKAGVGPSLSETGAPRASQGSAQRRDPVFGEGQNF